MAIQTRRSQGSWSSVSNAPSYGAVVSQYAAAIKQAQIAQENTELQGKVFDYQEGNLSYQDLTTFLNGRLSEATPDSKKALDLRMLLADAGKAEDSKQMKIKRAELEARFAKNGISADEQLQIEREMLQYAKEGTPEYTEQLSSIATVQELARVEKNNMEVAKLQTELSKGGISTGESIQLYKKMKEFTEPGSTERANIDTKLGQLEEDMKEERLAEARNQLLSDLYDKYTDGGISLEESLDMTRQMQTLTTPGTEEYIKLKEEEASILNSINKQAAQDGSLKAATNQIKAYITERETAIAKLDKAFGEGAISPDQYLEQKFTLQSEIGQVFEENPDLIEQSADLANDFGRISAGLQDTVNTFEMVQNGEILPIRNKSGMFDFVPNNPESLRASSGTKTVSRLNTEIDEYIPIGDAEGNVANLDVVTVVQNGKPVSMRLHEDGSLEPLNQTGKGEFIETGMRYDPVTGRETKKDNVDVTGLKTGKSGSRIGVGPKLQNFAQKTIEATPGIGSAIGLYNQLKNLPENLAAARDKLDSRVTMSPSQPSILADAKSAAKSILSPSLQKASASFESGKKMTEAVIPSASSSISNLLKSLQTNASSFKMPTLNLPKSTPGKVNIGKINLPEYGVSEKISSTAKNLFGKAKSYLSGLFK